MMDSSSTSPADSLSEEHEAVRTLTQLLKLEQEHLIAANVEGIAALTESKAKTVARMSTLASRRHQALGAAGFEAKESGMKNWLKNTANSATITSSWDELIELAEIAKELNRVNGTLIHKQIVRNQNVLNVLQYGTIQGNNVYGPNGQTANKPLGRRISAG